MQLVNNVESEAIKHAGALVDAAEAIRGGELTEDHMSNISAKEKCKELFNKSHDLRENYKKLMEEDSSRIIAVSEEYKELDDNAINI